MFAIPKNNLINWFFGVAKDYVMCVAHIMHIMNTNRKKSRKSTIFAREQYSRGQKIAKLW